MDSETKQSAVERINRLIRCGYEVEPLGSGTFDCITMRHPDRTRPFVYAYEDGTVVFDKMLANPPINDRFHADEVDAFNRYVQRIEPPNIWVLLKKGLSGLLAIVFVAAIVFSGSFVGAFALTFIDIINIQQAWQLSLVAVGLNLIIVAWNTLVEKTRRA